MDWVIGFLACGWIVMELKGNAALSMNGFSCAFFFVGLLSAFFGLLDQSAGEPDNSPVRGLLGGCLSKGKRCSRKLCACIGGDMLLVDRLCSILVDQVAAFSILC